MSKKIQISTVEMTANAQVINLNAYFISKAVEAKLELINALKDCKYKKHIVDETDTDGNETKGHDVTEYNRYKMMEDQIEAIDTKILPFLEELVDAFNEE